MRFMMLMIPAVYQGATGRNVGADFAPDAEAVERMTKYNEELARAGALIALDGLHPPGTGARIAFNNGRPKVTVGSVPTEGNVLGGYWMIQVKSREEAIEWARRVPADDGDVVEVRQVFEVSEFPEEVRKAADNSIVQAEVDKHRRSA